MKRVSREEWHHEDRNTNFILLGLMVLLSSVVVCAILSVFSIVSTFIANM